MVLMKQGITKHNDKVFPGKFFVIISREMTCVAMCQRTTIKILTCF